MDIDLNKLTPEQKAQLKEQLAASEAADKKKRADDVAAYKQMVSEAVEGCFPMLQEQSQQLADVKDSVYKMFAASQEIKKQLYKTKKDAQWSHTFINETGDKRITLGFNTLDTYDDTANEGISMVNEYLDSLAENNQAAEQAVKICRSLMARDKKGNLKPSKIVLLRKHALESGDKKFVEGVDIITAAYNPTASKQYVRAEYKDEKGVWKNVPLGMTEAE